MVLFKALSQTSSAKPISYHLYYGSCNCCHNFLIFICLLYVSSFERIQTFFFFKNCNLITMTRNIVCASLSMYFIALPNMITKDLMLFVETFFLRPIVGFEVMLSSFHYIIIMNGKFSWMNIL